MAHFIPLVHSAFLGWGWVIIPINIMPYVLFLIETPSDSISRASKRVLCRTFWKSLFPSTYLFYEQVCIVFHVYEMAIVLLIFLKVTLLRSFAVNIFLACMFVCFVYGFVIDSILFFFINFFIVIHLNSNRSVCVRFPMVFLFFVPLQRTHPCACSCKKRCYFGMA